MRVAFRLAAILIATSFAGALAQQVQEALPADEEPEAVEPIRRYMVELIVFTYAESISAGTEIWLPDEPALEAAAATIGGVEFDPFGEPLTEVDMPSIARRYMDPELDLFTKDDFTMNGIYDKLVELDAYEPIIRSGWTQPTYERAVTASIPIETLAQSPPWLDGDITLYLGRYLHLVIDLTMNADRSANSKRQETSPGVLSFGDSRLRNEYGMIGEDGNPVPAPVRYRISEDRIVKNGDIRYFDHPKFGVIAKITRFEEEQEEIIDDTDDLLPGAVSSP